MTVIMFIGPTISEREVKADIDAICLPPAAQGDIYRAMNFNPAIIGLVDGYFDGVASVWHKEILWAMNQGVYIYGASSMGALRAAELASFGMRGVGAIFEDYHSGKLEDDDEVAVVHGPAEIGYPALTAPMVNVRATLDKAVREKILNSEAASRFMNAAKAINYRDRTWEKLLESKEASGSEFGAWLPENAVDQKKSDAVSMIREIKEAQDQQTSTHVPGFEFEITNLWVRGCRHWDSIPNRKIPAISTEDEMVLQELRLMPDEFRASRDAATLRLLVSGQIHSEASNADREVLLAKLTELRQRHRLPTRTDLVQWIEDSQIGEDELEKLLTDEVNCDTLVSSDSPILTARIVKNLRLSGKYHSLLDRARAKAEVVSNPVNSELSAEMRMPGFALFEWYCSSVLGERAVLDIDLHLEEFGYGSREELFEILGNEYRYTCLTSGTTSLDQESG